jgi:hypothetical protein
VARPIPEPAPVTNATRSPREGEDDLKGINGAFEKRGATFGAAPGGTRAGCYFF